MLYSSQFLLSVIGVNLLISEVCTVYYSKIRISIDAVLGVNVTDVI